MKKIKVTTKEVARSFAIRWQEWQSKQSLSYGELLDWQGYFSGLAKRFSLTREFQENGII
jgi:hypothetical protein